jgi:hypothetical protein
LNQVYVGPDMTTQNLVGFPTLPSPEGTISSTEKPALVFRSSIMDHPHTVFSSSNEKTIVLLVIHWNVTRASLVSTILSTDSLSVPFSQARPVLGLALPGLSNRFQTLRTDRVPMEPQSLKVLRSHR